MLPIGPWTFDGDNPANQGFDVAQPDGGVIATAYYCEDGEGREYAEAAAQLIARAPELLDLLRRCIPLLAESRHPDADGLSDEAVRLTAALPETQTPQPTAPHATREALLKSIADLLPWAERHVRDLDARSAGTLYPQIRAATLGRAREAIARSKRD